MSWIKFCDLYFSVFGWFFMYLLGRQHQAGKDQLHDLAACVLVALAWPFKVVYDLFR
ncbi:MAG: hypothetical protein M0Q44_01600 [Methylobacter sp.]|nr:hypothetical protein [Methylobacter sp.]